MERKYTIFAIVFSVITLIPAVWNVVAFPWYQRVVPGICLGCCLVKAAFLVRRRDLFQAAAMTGLSIAGFLLLRIFLVIAVPREGHQEHSSPLGTRAVIIEYDHASRPAVYLKYGMFMKRVETPVFPGSMAVLRHSVEWLSEDQIVLKEEPGGSPVTIRLK